MKDLVLHEMNDRMIFVNGFINEAVSFEIQSFCILEMGERVMETRVAVISIIIEDSDSVKEMNELLHQYGEYVIGRMGIPYREKEINIISVAIDAPQDAISTLSGKIGKLKGVSSKVAYSNIGKK